MFEDIFISKIQFNFAACFFSFYLIIQEIIILIPNIRIIFNIKCSKMTLLKVSLIKYTKDDAPKSVNIVNFVKIISLENV